MTVGHAVLFWLASFINIFVLGFQSRNVNSGRYVSAAVTSSLTAISSLLVWRTAVEGNLWVTTALYMTSGPAGIVAAMLVSHHAFDRRGQARR